MQKATELGVQPLQPVLTDGAWCAWTRSADGHASITGGASSSAPANSAGAPWYRKSWRLLTGEALASLGPGTVGLTLDPQGEGNLPSSAG